MPTDLMSAKEWLSKSNAGFFARRKNPLLKKIDWLVETYHKSPKERVVERAACLTAIAGQCHVWLEAKKAKGSNSTRAPAVQQLRQDALDVGFTLDKQVDDWAKARGSTTRERSASIYGENKDLHRYGNDKKPDESGAFEPYWLEAHPDNVDHIFGQDLKIHFYDWYRSDQKNTKGFFEWLREQDVYQSLADTRSVEYMDSIRREDYRIDFAGGRLWSKINGVREPFETGNCATAFMGVRYGMAMFVISPDEVMYAGEQQVGKRHHSSFLAGGPVLAAGELGVSGGVIKSINNSSGHYRPCDEHSYNMLRFLRRRGVNLATFDCSLEGSIPRRAIEVYDELRKKFSNLVQGQRGTGGQGSASTIGEDYRTYSKTPGEDARSYRKTPAEDYRHYSQTPAEDYRKYSHTPSSTPGHGPKREDYRSYSQTPADDPPYQRTP